MTEDLLAWYERHRRDLPWRRQRTPYRVWVAEVMLQQTQVATVVPYYRNWLELFPDVATLAAAPADEVLKAWEGLGYYRRALQLHRAAREIQQRFDGALPADPAVLQTLPGIGPYTAAAIASIAYGVAIVAVDGNVARVATRLAAKTDLTPRKAAAVLAPLQPAARPGDFNEALMELGALVCTARDPRCGRCPLRTSCRAHGLDRVADFPRPKPRKRRPLRTRYALVYRDGDAVALGRRADAGLLPGLWGFPQSEVRPSDATLLSPLRHGYTHFELELVPALIAAPPPETELVPIEQLDDLAASVVDRKLLARLAASSHGEER